MFHFDYKYCGSIKGCGLETITEKPQVFPYPEEGLSFLTHNLIITPLDGLRTNVRPLKFWFPVNALKWYSIILFPLVIFHLEVSLCLSKTQWAPALSSLGNNSIVVSFSFSRTVAVLRTLMMIKMKI